jgi:hypothetical protein
MQRLAAAAINDRAFEIAEREMLSNSNRSTNGASSQAPALPQNSITTSGSRVITGQVRQHVPPSQRNPSDPAPDQTSPSVNIGASGNNPAGSSNRHVNSFSCLVFLQFWLFIDSLSSPPLCFSFPLRARSNLLMLLIRSFNHNLYRTLRTF